MKRNARTVSQCASGPRGPDGNDGKAGEVLYDAATRGAVCDTRRLGGAPRSRDDTCLLFAGASDARTERLRVLKTHGVEDWRRMAAGYSGSRRQSSQRTSGQMNADGWWARTESRVFRRGRGRKNERGGRVMSQSRGGERERLKRTHRSHRVCRPAFTPRVNDLGPTTRDACRRRGII